MPGNSGKKDCRLSRGVPAAHYGDLFIAADFRLQAGSSVVNSDSFELSEIG